MHRPPRALAVAAVLTVALVGVACGTDGGGDDDTGSASPADEAAAAEALQETADAAATYVTDLGPEGAFAAVVIALDRGYTADQLVPAADLTADGNLDGAEPVSEPQGLVQLPGDGDGGDEDVGASGADIAVRLVSTGAALPTQDDVDPTEAALLGLDLTVGDAHRQAAGQAYLEEMGWPEPPEAVASGGEATVEGYELTITLLALARSGYSVEQIITAVVTGDVTTDIIFPSCYVIPDEAPELDVGSDDPCAMAARESLAGESDAADGDADGAAEEQIELTGTFTKMTGALERIVTNELRVTVTTDGRVSGEGTIVTRTNGTVESTDCYYDYEWQADFVVAGSLTDTATDGGGTLVDLQLTSEQHHNFNRSDEECPVQIVNPIGETTATGELILSDPASMTATIEPATPSPFVHIPSFEVSEQ